jgi:hypothetical protein
MFARISLSLALLGLLGACSGSDESSEAGESNINAAGGPDLVFAGPKAPQGGNASAPTGSLAGKKAGDDVTISYAPQRVRGCDGGGWGQSTSLKFLDASGREVGTGADGSAFAGTGMVPKGQPPLTLSARIPAGAVKVSVLSFNDGGPHRATDAADTPAVGDNKGADGFCSDTIDGRGWIINIGGGSTATPPPPPPTVSHKLVPGIYEAKDTRNESAIMTVRRSKDIATGVRSGSELRYDLTLKNGTDEVTIHNMWGIDEFGTGAFITPAISNNDCDIKLTVNNGTINVTQGDSSCASQGLGRQQIVDGTYTLKQAGAPPSDVVKWTGSYVEPSPGTVTLDISVQTEPAPGSSAYTFAFAYNIAGTPLNGIAKVTDQNSPATSTVSGCPLSFDWLLDRVTVLAQTDRAECNKLGFDEAGSNTLEFLSPKP